MSFIHVFVVTTVLQWSVVTGEGRADQLTLSLCRVWEECLETAIDDNLEHAELGTPKAICGDFLEMIEKHGVHCEFLTDDEGGAEIGDSKQHQRNHLSSPYNLWKTTYFEDCSEINTAQAMFGSIASGVFTIKPAHANDPVFVYCDQTTDGGGWTVIQRRFDGSLEFFRKINAYRDGFGDCRGEYWLGLNNIYYITAHNPYELYIELEDWEGNVKYARYSTFSVGPGGNYTLSVGGYSGTAGDGFGLSDPSYTNNGARFSARWYDQDALSCRSMVELYGGGWWYFGTHLYGNLNGPYFRDTDNHINHNGVGVYWYPFENDNYYSLKKTKMMIRPTDFSTRESNMNREKL